VTAVLKAYGIKPVWKAYGWTALTPACRDEFRRINLHWHDLRHEYASRLVEHGVPLSQVRGLLGHASIVTTERYDNQQLERLQIAAGKLESGKLFEAPSRESGTDFHISCTTAPAIETKPSSDETSDGSRRCTIRRLRSGWEAGIRAHSDRACEVGCA
jgi:Phage integrase family